jgi:hypothetical protein
MKDRLARSLVVVVVAAACGSPPRPQGPVSQGAPSTASDDYKKCVLDEPDLAPAQPPILLRAAVQDASCKVILDKADKQSADARAAAKCDTMAAPKRADCETSALKTVVDGWKCDPTPTGDVLAAVKFCKQPLVAPLVTPAVIEAVRAALEETGVTAKCDAAESKGVVSQSTAAGLPFQDAVLRGLADFIVARAKAEAMAFLIDRLANGLCKVGEAKELLPTSCALIGDGKDAIAWGTLKAAFETDMQRFPERALVCAANRGGAPIEVQRLLYLTAQGGRLIHSGEDPLHILAGLKKASLSKEDCAKDPLACGLHVVGHTVQLLMPRESGGKPEPDPENVDRFVRIAARRWWDEMTRLGFVSGDLPGQFAKLELQLQLVHAQVRSIAQVLEDLAQASSGDQKPDRLAAVARLARTAIQLTEMARTLAKDWLVPRLEEADRAKFAELDTKAAKALKVAGDALDAYDKIAHREYAHVYVAVALAWTALSFTSAGKKLDREIRKYMPFIAEVAAAKTADDVKRAIETAAAPVGAALAKRGTGHRTIAINAFAGGIVGGERSFQLGKKTHDAWHGGLFVPVGVDVSWGLGDSFSLGGFLSVLDLGAIANFRWGDDAATDTIENAPQIGLKQVVSPGAYFVLGFDRVAFGVGASMAPELRKVTMGNAVIEHASTVRVGAFLAIDVTMFQF